MRAILVLLFSLAIILTNAQLNQRTARCVFSSFSMLSGTVMLTYDGTAKTTTFNVSVNAGNTLIDDNNALHIHQVGIDSTSTTCGDALKHYNPITNYGELTGVSGNISKNGSAIFTSSIVKLEGPYNVLGRAIVFHNSSNYRLACCTIELTSDTLTTPAAGYDQSMLTVTTPFSTVTLSNIGSESYFNISVNATHPYANGTLYVSHVHQLGLCDTQQYGGVLKAFPIFSNVTLSANVTFESDISKLAGRAYVVHNSADILQILSCNLVVQRAYQPNVADNYVPTPTNTDATPTPVPTDATPTPTPAPTPGPTPNPTPTPSGSGAILGFSVLLALFANLF